MDTFAGNTPYLGHGKEVLLIFMVIKRGKKMKSAILTGGSGKSFELLLELAKKLGIKAKVLSEEELEDAGLLKAIKAGRTGKYVDTEKFLKTLK